MKLTTHISPFVPMVDIVPEGEIGNAKIGHFEIEDDIGSKLFNLRATREGQPWAAVKPGRYAKLLTHGSLMMTDTPMEQRTNLAMASIAEGDVLIGGLGLGMLVVPLLAKEAVRSLTVVEIMPEVISLVWPALSKLPGASKLRIICGDINSDEIRAKLTTKFDTIYFDIWRDLCTDNLENIAALRRRFSRRLNRENPRAYMGAWVEHELRAERKRGR
jgi:hypothetical protein